MSLIIKELKLPKDGEFLDLVITADGKVACYDAEDRKIAEAVELPDHGDLIDRDALKRLRKCEIDEYSDGWTFKDLWEEEEKDMDSLPVIIPAERSEE